MIIAIKPKGGTNTRRDLTVWGATKMSEYQNVLTVHGSPVYASVIRIRQHDNSWVSSSSWSVQKGHTAQEYSILYEMLWGHHDSQT